jgi:serine/threonine-protein kinase
MTFLAELKRRNVIRVAIAYMAVSWLVAQAGALVFGALELPGSVLKGLLAILAIGFIPTLVFSWLYELTPEGLKRESEIDRTESITRLTGRKLDFLVIGVLVAVVALLLVDKFALSPRTSAPAGPSVAAVENAPAEAAKPPAESSAASIAVLPFVDMSQSKDQEYFSDGLSEELLNLLAKIPELRVIARTSSFSFKGKEADIATIAKALNVATVLEGSVRKSGNTLRITAQLIRTGDSTHLWSETYDREMTDIFKVQDEIAAAVVSALKLKLLAAQPVADKGHKTANVEAYNEYLLGVQSYNRTNLDGWRESEAAFKRAVALDPNYAAAWAGLSRTQTLISDFHETAEDIAEAKRQALASAEKAIALAPELGDAYDARGYLRGTTLWNWGGAEADFEKALALDPGATVVLRHRAELWAFQGRFSEAIAALRRLIESDPLYSHNWIDLGSLLTETGEPAAAREALTRAAQLNPESSFAWINLAFLELTDGKVEAAQAAFAKSRDIWPVIGRALVEHKLGHAEAAQAALDELIRRGANGAAYQIAEVHAWRGEPDHAFEWLERGYAQRDAGMAYIKFDVFLKPLRGDPRYAALLKKMGLPDAK